MGTDIHGIIECRAEFGFAPDPDVEWERAIDLGLLYSGRNYDVFGCLFGVQNFAGFVPVVAGRGIPDDAALDTRRTMERWGREAHSHSWLDVTDLEAIDWDEAAAAPDARIQRFQQGPDGEWKAESKAEWDATLAAATGHQIGEPMPQYPEGTEWQVGDRLYRVIRLVRRDAVIADDWSHVFDVMRTLARLHGPHNVRLVVWFDA